jgi:hypothetical protein
VGWGGVGGGGTEEPACGPNSLIRYLTIEFMSPFCLVAEMPKKTKVLIALSKSP